MKTPNLILISVLAISPYFVEQAFGAATSAEQDFESSADSTAVDTELDLFLAPPLTPDEIRCVAGCQKALADCIRRRPSGTNRAADIASCGFAAYSCYANKCNLTWARIAAYVLRRI